MFESIQNLTSYFSNKYFDNQILEEKVNTMVQKLYNPILAQQSKAEGKVELLYTRFKMNDKEISKELKMPLETVKKIIKEFKL